MAFSNRTGKSLVVWVITAPLRGHRLPNDRVGIAGGDVDTEVGERLARQVDVAHAAKLARIDLDRLALERRRLLDEVGNTRLDEQPVGRALTKLVALVDGDARGAVVADIGGVALFGQLVEDLFAGGRQGGAVCDQAIDEFGGQLMFGAKRTNASGALTLGDDGGIGPRLRVDCGDGVGGRLVVAARLVTLRHAGFLLLGRSGGRRPVTRHRHHGDERAIGGLAEPECFDADRGLHFDGSADRRDKSLVERILGRQPGLGIEHRDQFVGG